MDLPNNKAVPDGAWDCGTFETEEGYQERRYFQPNIFLELKLKAEKICYNDIFMLLYLR